MKKFFFCVSLVVTGLMTSCIDKNEEVDADARPSWLGESIYAELKNPTKHNLLTGTFTNYLRLIDDLGYDEVLSRTGSKTVFPANDEAFERFFKSNDWGVKSYSELSLSQKKLLLYSSMLDNALLLGMLPNVSNGTNEPMNGYALRHATNVSIIDSVQFLSGSGSQDQRPASMPANNSYWKKFYDKGIYVVSDATRPMMVHLTREYMLSNNITTLGDQSDFAILTGEPFTEDKATAYLFDDRVVNGNITCQNGYIHQMNDVVVPPGNMAQVLRRKDNTQLMSRIVDYFCAPYYDATTTQNYHDWYREQERAGINMAGVPNPDSIYQVRFLSNRSQGEVLQRTPDRVLVSTSDILSYDPGWNHYYPRPSRETALDYEIMDMGSFFVPSDDAVKQYFLPGGAGAYLIDIYGDKPNTVENLAENIDSLYSKNSHVLTAFTNNLLKGSFASTVPSKFESIVNDASENMGLNLGLLNRKADGKYDITIANNGAIYVLNELIAPDEYQCVMAPASVYPDMKVMNWLIQDRTPTTDAGRASEKWHLNVDFKYYLLAMSANYAFFIPEDSAFSMYYLDPTSLGHLDPSDLTRTRTRPDVLHVYYDPTATTQPYLKCNRHYFNMETGEVDQLARPATIEEVKSVLVDILNYHTLVLGAGEQIGSNHYYKTKHGGEVYVDGNQVGSHVMSGLQIEYPQLFAAPEIKTAYNEKNGVSYRMSHVIQPPTKSVYSVLSENDQFSEFLRACMGFTASNILEWAGISKVAKEEGLPSPQDAFTIFTHDYKAGTTTIADACLDYNVKMFNTYNYTLFAPDNAAMEQAYQNGLPRWEDIRALFQKYHGQVIDDEEEDIEDEEGDDEEPVSPAEQADKAKAYMMIKALRDFVRFHFVTNSVYADNSISQGRYQTLSSDDMGVAKEVTLSGGKGTISVKDMVSGRTVTVNAADASKTVNRMTRDYWFDSSKTTASSITTSSFCAVHQISEPLYGISGRFDTEWASRAAFEKAMQTYLQQKANNEL